MPHSSGGGSHGGGSHGGSHHSGGSHRSGRRGSSNRVASSAFAGATRYVYYRDRKPVFIYSNYDITKKANPIVTAIGLLFLLFMLLGILAIGAAGVYASIKKPKPLSTANPPKIVIEDGIGVLEDEDGLMDSLEAFYDKTGITPAVVTVSNEVWKGRYDDLEDYAYDDYVNRFKDEKHWLIVYSASVKEDGFDDWHWEGMQGNDTDPILTDKITREFTDNLQKLLLQRDKYSVDKAIAKAFDDLTPKTLKATVNYPVLAVVFFMVFLLGGIIVDSIVKNFHPVRDRYYQKAVVCDPKFVDQEPCEYCGGVYVVGMHLSCPHCGAPVRPHDYTTDAEGNITNILK